MTIYVHTLESAHAAPTSGPAERRRVAVNTSNQAEPACGVQTVPCEPYQPATLEMLRTKLAGLVQAGRQSDVRALLRHYGAERLSDVPAYYFDELLHAAEKLG